MEERQRQLEVLDARLRAVLVARDRQSRSGRPSMIARPVPVLASPTPAASAPTKPNPAAGWIALAVIGFVVWFFVFRGGGGTPSPSRAAAPIVPAAELTVRPAAGILLDLQGSGIKKSRPFTATGPWTLGYDFDCSAFGQAGNFIVTVYGTDGSLVDIAVNELAAGGHDTTQGYDAGELYLDMNSECAWSVRVTG